MENSFLGRLSAEEVNGYDLVEFLATLGYQPDKPERNGKAWYISPLPDRNERTASFVVYTNKNRWIDYGTGKGGSLIDFGMAYFNCSFVEFMRRMEDRSYVNLPTISKPLIPEDPAVKLLRVKPIQHYALLHYAKERHIELDVLRKNCCEVDFSVYNKPQYAIGILNNSGGYELRNKFFKGNTNPKDCTLVDNGAGRLSVFEGLFDYLSYLTITANQPKTPTDFLILNSTSFFSRELNNMHRYPDVRLFLDNDSTGTRCLQQAQTYNKEQYKDERGLYAGYNDLNDWHQNMGKGQQQDRGEGRSRRAS